MANLRRKQLPDELSFWDPPAKASHEIGTLFGSLILKAAFGVVVGAVFVGVLWWSCRTVRCDVCGAQVAAWYSADFTPHVANPVSKVMAIAGGHNSSDRLDLCPDCYGRYVSFFRRARSGERWS